MSIEQNNIPSYPDDEITLKELIQKLLEYWRELWNKKWWIILLSLPFATYFGYKGFIDPVRFKAELTYTLSDGGGASGLSGLLGSFGIANSGKLNLDRIVEMSKSRSNINKILFTKIPLDTFDNKVDYVANHLITISELDEELAKMKPKLKSTRFKNDDIKSFTKDELKLLKYITTFVLKGNKRYGPIFSSGYNEDTGILSMSTMASDEQLSIFFANKAFENIKTFYTESKTTAPIKNVNFIEAKKDSISGLLRAKQVQLTRFIDSHRNLVDPDLLAEKRMIETDIQKLTMMYGEVTKNFEMADFSLSTSEPEVKIIDEPLMPLDSEQKSWIIEVIKGGLIGLLIGSILILIISIVNKAMKQV